MPTYGYRCQGCNQEFEVFQRMSDEPKASCPDCGGAGKRLFYPAGIVFKGGGFYKTDSRGSSSVPAARPADDKAAKPAATAGADGSASGDKGTKGSDSSGSGGASGDKASGSTPPAGGSAPSSARSAGKGGESAA